MHLSTAQTDVFIAGAGPAGLACAIAAALQGLTVQVIDAMQPPIDKACGEGLLPSSLESLYALGFDLKNDLHPTDCAILRGVRFIGHSSSSKHSTTVQAAFPADPGLGVRRTTLHQLLLNRAASLGVRFHWKNTIRGIVTHKKTAIVHTNSQTFRARYLIGADGPRSRVATWAGLTEASILSRRIGLRQHYAIAPWTEFVEVHWSDLGQAYVTPNSANEVCVAFIGYRKFASHADALSHFPALHRRLAHARLSDSARGSVTLIRQLRRVTSGNIALIGDASGSVDAITGEGMALCFRQAAALAPALKANNLGAYQRAHRRIQRLPTLMSRSLLLIGSSPRLRNRAFSAFQHSPWLFERLLQLHIGHSSQRPFAEDRLLRPGYSCKTT
jgi:flavin-dependent dehydrogenase